MGHKGDMLAASVDTEDAQIREEATGKAGTEQEVCLCYISWRGGGGITPQSLTSDYMIES